MSLTKPVFLLSFCVIVISVVAIHQAVRAPQLAIETFGSGTAPMVVAILLILLAIGMAVEETSGRNVPTDAETPKISTQAMGFAAPMIKGVFLVFALVGYVVLLEQTDISFWILSLIFLVTAARILEADLRRWLLLSIATSAFLAISIEVLLSRLLLVSLP